MQQNSTRLITCSFWLAQLSSWRRLGYIVLRTLRQVLLPAFTSTDSKSRPSCYPAMRRTCRFLYPRHHWRMKEAWRRRGLVRRIRTRKGRTRLGTLRKREIDHEYEVWIAFGSSDGMLCLTARCWSFTLCAAMRGPSAAYDLAKSWRPSGRHASHASLCTCHLIHFSSVSDLAALLSHFN